MKKIFLFLLFILIIPISVYAKSGCCSSHGGVDCSRKQSNGKVICNDGWTGSSCYYNEMKKCEGYIEETKEEQNEILIKDVNGIKIAFEVSFNYKKSKALYSCKKIFAFF